MTVKTASVNSRMRQDIKQQAESILSRLGIPRSVAIDMYYRQIIAHNGIPFGVTLPHRPQARDEMTDADFDEMMAAGLEQAKSGDAFDANDVFSEMEREASL
ncbi:MAG: type II toxin-antitoxin system RelB/DinJ family antitoxin [Mailhella sp.]|nr:type II toxin-antitoxin system RelB/DinJ family antitoxin [Mailhella sp.]